MKRNAIGGILAATALLATSAASAQAIDPDESLRAEVVSADETDRTITVLLREDGTPRTFAFSDDAGVYTFDGRISRPQTFGDLRPGSEVLLEFDNLEGTPTIRKVTMGEGPADDSSNR
jgi:hypothetical protein